MPSLANAPRLLKPLDDLLMAYDTAFPHLFQPLANQRVLVGVQFDIVSDRLVDEIAARTFLRRGQRIKGVDFFSDGAETDGFFIAAHNTEIITHIILYHRASIRDSVRRAGPAVYRR